MPSHILKASQYDGEEYVYWQKIGPLQEKLELLVHVPENAINIAAHTLIDLGESWDHASRLERQDLVRVMIQEVACEISTKKILWLKVHPGFEALFQLLDGLRPDYDQRYWIEKNCGLGNSRDIKEPKSKLFH